MEHLKAHDKALKYLKQADHLLQVTYPLINDSKILLAVVDNIFLANANLLSSLLAFERKYKRVDKYQDTFDDKLAVFQAQCVRRFKIDPSYLELLREVQQIVVLHKKSAVEFRRKDRFVICLDNYQMVIITLNQLKGFIRKTKDFVKIVDNILYERSGLH